MTTLPSSLQTAIEIEIDGVNQNALSIAYEQLSNRYREKQAQGRFMGSNIDRKSYIACRMPATYAVIMRIFSEIGYLIPDLSPKTIADFGSGPGTALWAASESFKSLDGFIALEQDADLIELGKRLIVNAEEERLKSISWKEQDLRALKVCPPADIFVASYALGELSEAEQIKLLAEMWTSVGQVLVLIEPGTPAGFNRIRAWRNWLIEAKANLLAPCTHLNTCPMLGSDWCHFSQRLPRTSVHRQLKGGSLGYEDEKYSYLIAVKECVKHSSENKPVGRILRHPQKHTGHLELALCTDEGLIKKTVSRRDGDLYKKARKCDWGDLL